MTEATFTDPNAEVDKATAPTAAQSTFSDEPAKPAATPDDIEAIRKRDAHAQAHIRTLEQEAALRRQEIEDMRKKLEEVQNQMNNREALEELLRKRADHDPDSTKTAGSQEEVVREVLTALKQQEVLSQRQANIKAALSKVQEVYGEQWKDQVKSTAQELGMSLADVDDLASRSPAAFERAFIKAAPQPTNGKPSGTVSSTAVAATASGEMTKEERQAKYREDPKTLFSGSAFERISATLKK